jgi:O-antigen/teichoic acid export membrane protein
LLTAAVGVHGVRDRLAADTHVHDPGVAVAFARVAALVGAILSLAVTLVVIIAVDVDTATMALLVACGVWLVTYPLRLPAMTTALRLVRPVRVMVLESIDAVVVPLTATVALAATAPNLGVMVIGIAAAACVGLALAVTWRARGVTSSSVRTARVAWSEARGLAVYQLVASGRELAIPTILLGTAGAAAAGAYGLAIPLGAMISLALAAAAQPAYGALVAVGADPARVATLTNVVRHLLASIVAVAVPLLWWLGAPVLEVLFGAEWTSATTTILVVMTAFAINAALVPWVNVLVHRRSANRTLVVSQTTATAVTVAAACTASVIGAEGVALAFLAAQVGFGIAVARTAHATNAAITITDQTWYALAASLGTAIVLAIPPLGPAGPLVALAVIAIAPNRRDLTSAWHGVAQTRRR